MSLYHTDHPPFSGATDEGKNKAVARSGDHGESRSGNSNGFERRIVGRFLGPKRSSPNNRRTPWNEDHDFVSSRAMEMLGDSRSSAHGVARLLDRAPLIADRVVHCAKGLYEKGPIKSTAHAVILIGYRRLRRILEGFSSDALRGAGGFGPRWALDSGESKRPRF